MSETTRGLYEQQRFSEAFGSGNDAVFRTRFREKTVNWRSLISLRYCSTLRSPTVSAVRLFTSAFCNCNARHCSGLDQRAQLLHVGIRFSNSGEGYSFRRAASGSILEARLAGA
jgi:hypothetical protein